jgi:hypothetical protein
VTRPAVAEVHPQAEAVSSGNAFVQAVEAALAAGDPGRITDAEVERVMTAAVRIYAAKIDADCGSPPPVTAERVTPTDIVVTVTALLKAAGLNLWDLSMWVQRP